MSLEAYPETVVWKALAVLLLMGIVLEERHGNFMDMAIYLGSLSLLTVYLGAMGYTYSVLVSIKR